MNLSKRCPWCGEIIKGRFFQRGRYHCPNCGNYSKIYRSGWVYGIGAIVGVGLIIFLKYMFAIYSLLIFWTIYSVICTALPLEMETKHFIPRKKSDARFTLIKDFSLVKRKLLFSEKQLFPICFVDINDKPISHTLCISVEDVKFISSESFDANIKFIPISNFNVDFNKGEKFYLFYDSERIAYCELKNNVE